MAKIKVVVKKVGKEPEVVEIEQGLRSMQEIVGRYIEVVELPHKVDMWINEEGLLIDLPMNLIMIDDDAVIHQIMGDIFFASYDNEGGTVGLTDQQIKWVLSRIKEVGIAQHPKKDDNKPYAIYGMSVRYANRAI